MVFKRLFSYLSRGVYGGWGVWGIGRVSEGGGGSNLNIIPFINELEKKNQISYFEYFTSKMSLNYGRFEVYTQKTENRPTYGDFGIHVLEPPTSPNF